MCERLYTVHKRRHTAHTHTHFPEANTFNTTVWRQTAGRKHETRQRVQRFHLKQHTVDALRRTESKSFAGISHTLQNASHTPHTTAFTPRQQKQHKKLKNTIGGQTVTTSTQAVFTPY